MTASTLEVQPEACFTKSSACNEPAVPRTVITNRGLKIASQRLVNNAPAPHKWITLGFSDEDKNLKLEIADELSSRYSVMELLPKAVQLLEFRVKGVSRASIGVDHEGRAFQEVKKDKMKGLMSE